MRPPRQAPPPRRHHPLSGNSSHADGRRAGAAPRGARRLPHDAGGASASASHGHSIVVAAEGGEEWRVSIFKYSRRRGRGLTCLRCVAARCSPGSDAAATRTERRKPQYRWRASPRLRVREEGGNRRRETGRPRRCRWPWAWCRRWRWEVLGRPGRLIGRGRLGEVRAAVATFGGEVCFVLCEEWLDEVRLKQKLRIFWQKCWKNDSFLINSFTSCKN